MKYFLTILFALLSCVSFAQLPVTHRQSNGHTKEQFDGAIYPVKGLINGRYADTAAANLDYVAGEKGIQIIVGNTIWIRDSTGTKWLAMDRSEDLVPLYSLISGGIVSYSGHGLTFYISPAYYIIGGKYYTSGLDSVTLDPASLTSRIDLFVVDTTGKADKMTGVADGNLLTPQPDPFSQIALTSGFRVNPGDTIPANITVKTIYDENLGTPLEWSTHIQGSITNDFANTSFPEHGVRNIFTTSYTNNSRFFFLSPSYDVITSDATLSAWIRLGSPLLNNDVVIFLYDQGTGAYKGIKLNTINGFNPNLVGEYQLISIPLYSPSWINYSGKWSELEFIFYGPEGNINLSVDNITIQKGINNLPIPGDYSGKADSVTVKKITIGSDTANIVLNWFKGISYPKKDTIWTNSAGNGIDSSSYHTTTQTSDTSYELNRPNGSKTVFLFESDTTGGGGGGTGSGVQSVVAGDNITVDNTDPSNPIINAVLNTVTASNGLTKVGDGIQLGGTLTKSDTVDVGTYILNFIGANTSPSKILNIENSGTGKGIVVSTEDDGAIEAYSTNATAFGGNSVNGVGVSAFSNNNVAAQFSILPSSTNNVQTVLSLTRATSGTAANGIGGAIDFYNGVLPSGNLRSNRLISKWLLNNTASTVKSEFSIQGVSDATGVSNLQTNLTISGDGATRLNQYGSGTFTGTPTYNLGVDASGNIIEVAAGGGSYTLPTASATVLGGVKVGSGLAIDGSGVLSATGGGTTPPWDQVTAIGNSSSRDVVINGINAGKGSGSISSNTVYGSGSLQLNTTGYENTSTGSNALYNNTTGHSNTAIGLNALSRNTTGYNNTGVGYVSVGGAASSNTTSLGNTGVGYYALARVTSGSENVAVGDGALPNITTGWSNVGVGQSALNLMTKGNYNTAVGSTAFAWTTDSLNYNTALGFGSFHIPSATNINNSTAVGANSVPTQSNQVVLGDVNVTQVLTYGNVLSKVAVKSSDPTTTDIPTGFTAVFRNSTSGLTYLWANISGTLIKIQLQ